MAARYKGEPLQDKNELAAFIAILRAESVRSYLEIGSLFGGSLWRIAVALPKGSRVVAVDAMAHHPDAKDDLAACITELRSTGYDAHFICGDSTDPETIARVADFAPFDAVFIDGCHAPEYVEADWNNYGPMARIVAFHDINWNETWRSRRGNTPDATRMGAPKFWDEVKQGRRFEEFRLYPPNNYYGIGVLWR
jgi:predicted O-methyltransferase YrrM